MITILYNDISFNKSKIFKTEIVLRNKNVETIEEAEKFKTNYDRLFKTKECYYIEIFAEAI